MSHSLQWNQTQNQYSFVALQRRGGSGAPLMRPKRTGTDQLVKPTHP